MQLHNRDFQRNWRVDDTDDDNSPRGIDFEAIFAIARRQWLVVAVCIAVALALGVVNIITAVPLYTASTKILIDRGNSEVVQQLSTIGGVTDDEPTVLSQVELLMSDTVALTVVDKLDLSNDPTFMTARPSLIQTIMGTVRSLVTVTGWLGSKPAEIPTSEEKRRAAADAVLANMSVMRVDRTYVLEVSYRSPSADMAARVANAIGDSYLVDKLNSKYDATRRASDWLQDRIAELRQKALDSDLAVQKFRGEHGLVAAGSVLMSDQQLSELNSALIVAQSDTSKAQARLERIESIIASGQSDAMVTDLLDNPVANELRQKYLAASKRETEISDRLGSNHIQAARLRSEMAEYQRQMFAELNRIAESYKSDLDVAVAREKSLTQSVSQATGVSATANLTQVQLRELEREAETYKNLYQTFLQRYQEAIQQQSFPVTEARIITNAVPPAGPSHPKKPLTLALFFLLGAAAGAGVGGWREYRDRFFRTGKQVQDYLGLEFLGMTPLVPNAANPAKSGVQQKPGLIQKTSPLVTYVVEHPLSPFAETLRSAKIAADLRFSDKPCKVIGIVSSLPAEGKSAISINFAELLARQGSKTLLIDADLRNPGTTRAIARHADAGLLEALLDGQDLDRLLLSDDATGLSVLPAVVRQRTPHSSELLASSGMRGLLKKVSEQYDYIVVDLPPLGPVVDARAIADRIDGFIFVAEWGATARRVAIEVLNANPQVRDKCIGVILNKVDQDRLKLYHDYGSNDYYYSRYSRYYHESN
nr:polysaccharide biosynthesis tyrosine autokinase [Agrobacterium sp. Ap1]